MRTMRNKRAHLAQRLKSTVRSSSVGPDACCLRHLEWPPSTTPALRLCCWGSHPRSTAGPFWQVPDPVKQAASPADEHAVADERSVRPERVPRGVVALFPQRMLTRGGLSAARVGRLPPRLWCPRCPRRASHLRPTPPVQRAANPHGPSWVVRCPRSRAASPTGGLFTSSSHSLQLSSCSRAQCRSPW